MNILLPGQYPRSEHLVTATRDFERNRSSRQDLERAQKEEVGNFLTLQSGFPFPSPGLFHWQDLLRPFTAILEGVYAETLMRFYETNAFWKKLECDGNFTLHHSQMNAWIEEYFLGQGTISKDKPLLLTLPFLYLFNDFSHGIPLEKIAEILATVAKALLALPNKILCFIDPTFGWRPFTQQEKEIGKQLIQNIKQTSTSPIYVCTWFFSVKQDLEFLFSLPADGFGIDFYANCLKDTMAKFPKDKTLIAGVINTDSTLIESQRTLKELLEHLPNHSQRLYLAPNSSAELLPRTVMDQKVKNLQEMVV